MKKLITTGLIGLAISGCLAVYAHTLSAMREAMRKVMGESYIAGCQQC